MKIDYPAPAQIDSLRRLWQQAFDDDDAFLDKFFSTGFAPDHCRCVMENGEAAAALYWLDMTCRGSKMAYLYAVATEKSHQNRGLCRTLMADVHEILAREGYAGSILVPEDEKLAAMYEKMGYRFTCSICQFVSTVGPYTVSGHRVDKAEYRRRRDLLLPEGGVRLGEKALDFLDTQAFFYAGPDFLVTAVKGSEGLRCLELLGNTDLAPDILNALGLTHGAFRAPGEGRPFAMYRPIDPAVAPPSYFGLAFD